MLLLDTNILIDVFKGHRAATEWLGDGGGDQELGFPAPVIQELLMGSRNKQEMAFHLKAFSQCVVFYPDENDYRLSFQIMGDFFLSHGIGANDALIAAIALNRSLPVYTLNEKHFEPIPGLVVVRPY